MKLYLVQISPCCRAVWLYCTQNSLPVEIIDVDIFGGEHHKTEFRKLNPTGEVPVLVDGEVTVSEAVPILLYLAEKYTSYSGFGETKKETMAVKSILSWTSSNLHANLGYRVVYPNFIESCQPGEEATETLIDKGTAELTKQLEFVENHLLGDTHFVVGHQPTVADFYLATTLCQLEWVSFEFNLWQKVTSWMCQLKKFKGWDEVHEKHNGFVAKLQSTHE